MATLAIASATGAITRLDIELRDDRDDRRQIGLILDNHAEVEEVGLTIGTAEAWYINDPINPLRRRRGAVGGWMAFVPAGFLPTQLDVSATKGSGLPMGLAPCLIQLLAEAAVVGLQFGEATLQLRNLALQASNRTVACAAAGARGEYHDNPPLWVP